MLNLMWKCLIPSAVALLVAITGFAAPVRTLNGDERNFPRDAEVPRSIFVVTFSKAASTQAADWTRRLHDLQGTLNASVIQVAILEDVPRLFRSVVVSAMSKEVPENLHDHFWVAVTDSLGWQRIVNSSAVGEPHIFVLDYRNDIIWRAHGLVSDTVINELLALAPPNDQTAPTDTHGLQLN